MFREEKMTQDELNEFKIALQRAKKEYESGRSMVEILGVLAVVGVLSVAGVAGFRTAMNRHKANELMNAASLRAVVARQQLTLGKAANQISFSEFTRNDTGYGTFDEQALGFNSGPFAFGIVVKGLEKSICQNLIGMGGKGVLVEPDLFHQERPCRQNNNDLVFLYCNDSVINCSMPTSTSECTDDERGLVYNYSARTCGVSL